MDAARASRGRLLVSHTQRYHKQYRSGGHGRGDADPLLDRLTIYEQLSAYAAVRQRLWAKKVHLPLEQHTLAAIRRSSASGLPYGGDDWVQGLVRETSPGPYDPAPWSTAQNERR
jgi:hypothetical protein